MRRQALLLFALALALPGCGGGNNARQAGRSVTVTIRWPRRSSRVIPEAAQYIVLQVNVGGLNGWTSTAARVNKPNIDQPTTTTTLGSLPAGSLTLTATAYDKNNVADATGFTVITTQANLPLNGPNNNQQVSITMDSTIAKISVPPVSPSTSTVEVGGTISLMAAATDASGATVLMSPDKLQWSPQQNSGANATVVGDPTTGFGIVTGNQVGTQTITVTDSESKISGSTNVTVTPNQDGTYSGMQWYLTPAVQNGVEYAVYLPISLVLNGTATPNVTGTFAFIASNGSETSVAMTGSLTGSTLIISGSSSILGLVTCSGTLSKGVYTGTCAIPQSAMPNRSFDLALPKASGASPYRGYYPISFLAPTDFGDYVSRYLTALVWIGSSGNVVVGGDYGPGGACTCSGSGAINLNLAFTDYFGFPGATGSLTAAGQLTISAGAVSGGGTFSASYTFPYNTGFTGSNSGAWTYP